MSYPTRHMHTGNEGVSIALALFLWGKDAGALRHVPTQERPPCPVTITQGAVSTPGTCSDLTMRRPPEGCGMLPHTGVSIALAS